MLAVYSSSSELWLILDMATGDKGAVGVGVGLLRLLWAWGSIEADIVCGCCGNLCNEYSTGLMPYDGRVLRRDGVLGGLPVPLHSRMALRFRGFVESTRARRFGFRIWRLGI